MDFSNYCNTCFSLKNVNTASVKIRNMLLSLVEKTVTVQNNVYICSVCCRKLESFNLFRRMCIMNLKHLQQRYGEGKRHLLAQEKSEEKNSEDFTKVIEWESNSHSKKQNNSEIEILQPTKKLVLRGDKQYVTERPANQNLGNKGTEFRKNHKIYIASVNKIQGKQDFHSNKKKMRTLTECTVIKEEIVLDDYDENVFETESINERFVFKQNESVSTDVKNIGNDTLERDSINKKKSTNPEIQQNQIDKSEIESENLEETMLPIEEVIIKQENKEFLNESYGLFVDNENSYDDNFESVPIENTSAKEENNQKKLVNEEDNESSTENQVLFLPKSGKNSRIIEKRYMCNVCKKLFIQSSHLSRHLLIHAEEKPFKCECGKSFRQSNQLVIHRYIHTGEKPFKCNICEKTFGDPSTLSKHGRVHTNQKFEQIHLCHICKKGFSKLGNFIRHRQTHHEENKS